GAVIIGVTATPLSSDPELPLHDSYDELIIGESIGSLIEQGFLAKPKVIRYDVELASLERGSKGDFTVGTSDELYSSPAMLQLLLDAYEADSKNKKTLIFNTGIFASRSVHDYFREAGYNIRHLDNNTPATERAEILSWFKKTSNAILTSVSILTTGFDEPTVKTVILNRATTSLTLYHQMIGRGARSLPKKKRFTIIDLGNNTERFGAWDGDVNWQEIFDHPQAFIEMINIHNGQDVHTISGDVRSKFPNSISVSFDVQAAHHEAEKNGEKPIVVLRDSSRQHAFMCIENADSICAALELAEVLENDIKWRVKQYTKCLGNVTKNYREWLENDYISRLKTLIQKLMQRRDMHRQIA
ncbi:MAG: DEAD/DEAH box helicase, partial [Sphingobacteriales bacterium]